jgi:hypothetical protein
MSFGVVIKLCSAESLKRIQDLPVDSHASGGRSVAGKGDEIGGAYDRRQIRGCGINRPQTRHDSRIYGCQFVR